MNLELVHIQWFSSPEDLPSEIQDQANEFNDGNDIEEYDGYVRIQTWRWIDSSFQSHTILDVCFYPGDAEDGFILMDEIKIGWACSDGTIVWDPVDPSNPLAIEFSKYHRIFAHLRYLISDDQFKCDYDRCSYNDTHSSIKDYFSSQMGQRSILARRYYFYFEESLTSILLKRMVDKDSLSSSD